MFLAKNHYSMLWELCKFAVTKVAVFHPLFFFDTRILMSIAFFIAACPAMALTIKQLPTFV